MAIALVGRSKCFSQRVHRINVMNNGQLARGHNKLYIGSRGKRSFLTYLHLLSPPFLTAGRVATDGVSAELVEEELVEELEEELRVTRALLARELESEDSREELLSDSETGSRDTSSGKSSSRLPTYISTRFDRSIKINHIELIRQFDEGSVSRRRIPRHKIIAGM